MPPEQLNDSLLPSLSPRSDVEPQTDIQSLGTATPITVNARRALVAVQLQRTVLANYRPLLQTWVLIAVLLWCGMIFLLLYAMSVYNKHAKDQCDQPLAKYLAAFFVLFILHAFRALYSFRQIIIKCGLGIEQPPVGRVTYWLKKICTIAHLTIAFIWPCIGAVYLIQSVKCSPVLYNTSLFFTVYYFGFFFIAIVLPAVFITVLFIAVRRGWIRTPEGVSEASEVLNKLETIPFCPEQFDDNIRASTCSVCMDSFDQHHRIVAAPCEHIYHSKCLQGWLACSRNCPLCRAPMDADRD
eukprot:GEMP01037319.1.p1 GENE.GEMP01037319.1~~GEMP01037319.1.p1  ORF type:complete len:298 (+),score=43.66 GEMP01037319.1:111-1004(+)